jgi:hypothetical protein
MICRTFYCYKHITGSRQYSCKWCNEWKSWKYAHQRAEDNETWVRLFGNSFVSKCLKITLFVRTRPCMVEIHWFLKSYARIFCSFVIVDLTHSFSILVKQILFKSFFSNGKRSLFMKIRNLIILGERLWFEDETKLYICSVYVRNDSMIIKSLLSSRGLRVDTENKTQTLFVTNFRATWTLFSN